MQFSSQIKCFTVSHIKKHCKRQTFVNNATQFCLWSNVLRRDQTVKHCLEANFNVWPTTFDALIVWCVWPRRETMLVKQSPLMRSIKNVFNFFKIIASANSACQAMFDVAKYSNTGWWANFKCLTNNVWLLSPGLRVCCYFIDTQQILCLQLIELVVSFVVYLVNDRHDMNDIALASLNLIG